MQTNYLYIWRFLRLLKTVTTILWLVLRIIEVLKLVL